MDTRHLLDTNVVGFLLAEQEEMSRRVNSIINDYNNVFYVSTVAVREMIHLVNAGKFGKIFKSAEDVLPAIEVANMILLPVKREHLATYAKLQPVAGHNDPNDHVIIAQAITERMPLVSSDHKFFEYTRQKLIFIFNER